MGQVLGRATIAAVLAALAGGCATRAMRDQAAALATAGEQLERETAAFASARTGVVQVRQRSLVEQRRAVAETGQQNAATLAQWRVAGTDDRARRLALFTGIREASEAMYEVRDESVVWEESVLASRTALAIDRAALHRFVLQLVRLSRPQRFMQGVKFYAEYGQQIAGKVDEGLKDVLAGMQAAEQQAPGGAGAGGGGGPTPTPTPTPGVPSQPIGSTPQPREPTDPNGLPVGPVDPQDPRPQPQPQPEQPGTIKSGQRRSEPAIGDVRGR